MTRVRIACLLLLLGSVVHAGSFGFKFDGTLDKEAISQAYFEGDFDRVRFPLEVYRELFPASATREDSIFVYKYLSVIYAADSTTRHKAEYYMVQLIRLVPTIELVDLYISDNIHAIFKDVKKKYLEQQQYLREHDAFGRPLQDTASVAQPSRKWIGWTLGGVGTAVLATGAYYLWKEDEKPARERVVLPTGSGQ